jgi:iron complex outermembrane receptor protein
MEQLRIKKIVLAAMFAVPTTSAFLVSGLAFSQQLEEVIVTARARSETLQDVPATITAFTENQIENSGIQRAEDFIYMTPGVTMVNTVEIGDTSLSIRGLNGARDAESNFAFIVDGILYPNPYGFNREFPDLAQIEVLKGPQGALYGRSAAAGAVIMSTKSPTESDRRIKLSMAEHGTYTAMATFAGELSDTTSGRLTVAHRTTDGFLKNGYLNNANVVNDYEGTDVSGRLLFEPTDALSIDTKLTVSEASGAPIAFNAAFALPAFVSFGFSEDFFIDVNDAKFKFAPNVRPTNDVDAVEFSVKADYDMDWASVSVWGMYSDQEHVFQADGTSASFNFYAAEASCVASLDALTGTTLMQSPTYIGGNAPGSYLLPPYSPTTCDGYQYQERNQEDISFQATITSTGDSLLRWQAGIYLLDIDRTAGVAQSFDDGRADLPETLISNLTDALVYDKMETSVYSVFGSVNYDVSDTIELSFALRYDREERDIESLVPAPSEQISTRIDYCNKALGAVPVSYITGGCTLNGLPLAGTPLNPAYFSDIENGVVVDSIAPRSKTFSEVQPKISITWDATDYTTVFGSWGVGFKTGGFNNLGMTELVDLFLVDQGADLVAPPEVYEKETSSAFEVGFNTTLADGRLNVNGAIFHTEVDDMQFFEFFVGPFGLSRVVENIDEVTLKGFELGAAYQITDELSLVGGYSAIDSEIDKNTIRPYTKGNDVPNAADFTANAALQYVQDIDGLEFTARLEYAYQGDMWFHTVQDDLVPATLFKGFGVGDADFSKTQVDGYGITNLRFGLSSETWKVAVFARNLLDEDYVAEVITAAEFGGAFIHPGAARTAGVELQYNF